MPWLKSSWRKDVSVMCGRSRVALSRLGRRLLVLNVHRREEASEELCEGVFEHVNDWYVMTQRERDFLSF